MTTDIQMLQGWIGRSEVVTDHVTVPAVHRLGAMLDRDDPMPRAGDPLPIGWYAILFPRVVRRSEIGPDGHPKRGDFLPPVSLPRRMFAGRRTTYHDALRVGDEAVKRSTIASVQEKSGRSGAMIFVTVRAEISSPRGLAIVEEQDIVYRGDPDPRAPAAPAKPQPAPSDPLWRAEVTPDEVMLFRYSALTFNGHRIHYDFPYVTRTEGYPALVINGGLTTLLLYELLRANAGRPVRAMTTRNVKPLFVGGPVTLAARPSADGASVEAWAADAQGALAVSAQAELA